MDLMGLIDSNWIVDWGLYSSFEYSGSCFEGPVGLNLVASSSWGLYFVGSGLNSGSNSGSSGWFAG